MSNRLNSFNGFETTLNGGINDTTDTITLVSIDNLEIDTFLVIDPDTPSLRDYVYVTAIDGGLKQITVRAPRPEEGSFQGIAHSHDDGAPVRAVPVHQWLDVIFTDIEALEAWDANHAPGTDPHPQYLTAGEGDADYLKLDGSNAMAADLNAGGNKVKNMLAGALDDDAAVLKQVTDGDAATLASANAHSDGLDHDHTTPIAAHTALDDAHHVKYTDQEAVDANTAVGVSVIRNHAGITTVNTGSLGEFAIPPTADAGFLPTGFVCMGAQEGVWPVITVQSVDSNQVIFRAKDIDGLPLINTIIAVSYTIWGPPA